jgi:aspartyl-tRNA(Asn)/glutamyl-tRNA(Gln) amidotransferase subunit C
MQSHLTVFGKLLLPLIKYECYNYQIMENIPKISREEVLHVARLARVGVSDEDVARLIKQLNNILENFAVLQHVDTDGVPPTSQSIPLLNVMKTDEALPSISQDEVLKNAPQREGEFFRIKAVLEE